MPHRDVQNNSGSDHEATKDRVSSQDFLSYLKLHAVAWIGGVLRERVTGDVCTFQRLATVIEPIVSIQ